MMKSRLLGAAAAAALLLLTSCLGDNNSNANYNMIPGVVKFDMTTMGNLLNSKAGLLSAKGLEKYGDGDCLIVNISINSDEQVSDKFVTATLTAEPTTVPKGQFTSMMTDTTVIGETEVPLLTSYEPSYMITLAYLDGYFFLPSGIKMPTDQKTTWELYADPQAKPVEVNGESVYSMFLRAKVRVAGEDKEQNILAPNAFYTKMFFDKVEAVERANQKKTYSVKIYYVKSINEKDRSEFTWAASDLIKFPVTEKKD